MFACARIQNCLDGAVDAVSRPGSARCRWGVSRQERDVSPGWRERCKVEFPRHEVSARDFAVFLENRRSIRRRFGGSPTAVVVWTSTTTSIVLWKGRGFAAGLCMSNAALSEAGNCSSGSGTTQIIRRLGDGKEKRKIIGGVSLRIDEVLLRMQLASVRFAALPAARPTALDECDGTAESANRCGSAGRKELSSLTRRRERDSVSRSLGFSEPKILPSAEPRPRVLGPGQRPHPRA